MNVMLVCQACVVDVNPQKMLFCLAEVVRERLRQHLASARSLTFHSDASTNRLLLFCQFCGFDLHLRRGLLGTQSLDDDSSAAGITTVTLKFMRDLCTPLSGAPLTSPPDTVTDLELL